MRHSAAIGIALYLSVVLAVVGGAYAAFDAIIGSPIGSPVIQTAQAEVIKQGAVARTSGKWTPVEIKREVAAQPALPAYVTPSKAARAQAAKATQKRIVVVAQRAAPAYEQQMAAYATPDQPERPRTFGPFNFGF